MRSLATTRWRRLTPPGPSAAVPRLTFALGGLSKSAGLPQLKLGWIAVDGPGRGVRAALQRLEIICDTYAVGLDADPGRGATAD